MTSDSRKRDRIYSSMREYKEAFSPEELDEELPYDNPEEFGRAVAGRHVEIIREGLRDWLPEGTTMD